MTDALSIDEIEARITGDTPIGRAPKNVGLWARHPEDYYIEEEWCSARLFDEVAFEGTIVDPSCGSGHIVRAARASRDNGHADSHIDKVLGYDIVKRGRECNDELEDFLQADYETDNIVSNPPFGLCAKATKKNGLKEDFAYVRQALRTATKKIALLLPLPWMTGGDKGRFLKQTPLFRVLVLTPRPSMPPGPVIEAGEAPGGGTEDFAWFIWDHAYRGEPVLGWLDRDG